VECKCPLRRGAGEMVKGRKTIKQKGGEGNTGTQKLKWREYTQVK
jgi:hypothetical protein